MRNFTFTLADLKACMPCASGYRQLLENSGWVYDSTPHPVVEALAFSPLIDCIWGLRACTPEPSREEVLAFAADLEDEILKHQPHNCPGSYREKALINLQDREDWRPSVLFHETWDACDDLLRMEAGFNPDIEPKVDWEQVLKPIFIKHFCQ